MAKKETVLYVSDLSGKDITDNDSPTVAFAWDGQEYTIDLTADEAERFYKAIEKYLSVATKVGGKKRGKKSGPKSNAAEVRAWAISQGMEVPDRGRIPAEIREAYESASA